MFRKNNTLYIVWRMFWDCNKNGNTDSRIQHLFLTLYPFSRSIHHVFLQLTSVFCLAYPDFEWNQMESYRVPLIYFSQNKDLPRRFFLSKTLDIDSVLIYQLHTTVGFYLHFPTFFDLWSLIPYNTIFLVIKCLTCLEKCSKKLPIYHRLMDDDNNFALAIWRILGGLKLWKYSVFLSKKQHLDDQLEKNIHKLV